MLFLTSLLVINYADVDVTAGGTKNADLVSARFLNAADGDGDGEMKIYLEKKVYLALMAADIDASGSIGVRELYSVIGKLIESDCSDGMFRDRRYLQSGSGEVAGDSGSGDVSGD